MPKKYKRWAVIVLFIMLLLLILAPTAFRIVAAILVAPAVVAGLYAFLRWYPDYERRQFDKND